MAVQALTNVYTYIDGHDFTSDQNQATLDMSGATLDVTNMGSGGWTEVIGGVKSVSLSQAGFWQAGADQVDPDVWAAFNTGGQVVTMSLAETEAATCYMFQAKNASYQMLGTYGEAAPFSVQAVGSNGVGVVKGLLAVANSSVSATGAAGTGGQVGAVAADEYLYATFHVFSPGTTITAVVESDDNSGFTSATTRATFGPITTKSGTWATRVAGAITDDWYRIRVTAITGTFTIAAGIGIA